MLLGAGETFGRHQHRAAMATAAVRAAAVTERDQREGTSGPLVHSKSAGMCEESLESCNRLTKELNLLFPFLVEI